MTKSPNRVPWVGAFFIGSPFSLVVPAALFAHAGVPLWVGFPVGVVVFTLAAGAMLRRL